VIDICAKFNDPLEACRAVVAESYELWLQYELRTDDITMICIFIDEVDPTLALSQRNSYSDLKSSALSHSDSVESIYLENDELVVSDSRPVRKNISLGKMMPPAFAKSTFRRYLSLWSNLNSCSIPRKITCPGKNETKIHLLQRCF
jgi:hypothetical protein